MQAELSRENPMLQKSSLYPYFSIVDWINILGHSVSGLGKEMPCGCFPDLRTSGPDAQELCRELGEPPLRD